MKTWKVQYRQNTHSTLDSINMRMRTHSLFVLLLEALFYKEKQKEKRLQNDEYRLFLLRLTDERGGIPFCSNLTLHLD